MLLLKYALHLSYKVGGVRSHQIVGPSSVVMITCHILMVLPFSFLLVSFAREFILMASSAICLKAVLL